MLASKGKHVFLGTDNSTSGSHKFRKNTKKPKTTIRIPTNSQQSLTDINPTKSDTTKNNKQHKYTTQPK